MKEQAAKGLARCIWYDESEKKYKVAENYIAYLLVKNDTYNLIKENKDNEEQLREIFGQYADNFYVLETAEDKRKDILRDFFSDKMGVLLTATLKEQWLKELKELGLCNQKYEKDYTFDYVIKKCREYKICDLRYKKANKKDCEMNPDLEHGKRYQQVILL